MKRQKWSPLILVQRCLEKKPPECLWNSDPGNLWKKMTTTFCVCMRNGPNLNMQLFIINTPSLTESNQCRGQTVEQWDAISETKNTAIPIISGGVTHLYNLGSGPWFLLQRRVRTRRRAGVFEWYARLPCVSKHWYYTTYMCLESVLYIKNVPSYTPINNNMWCVTIGKKVIHHIPVFSDVSWYSSYVFMPDHVLWLLIWFLWLLHL